MNRRTAAMSLVLAAGVGLGLLARELQALPPGAQPPDAMPTAIAPLPDSKTDVALNQAKTDIAKALDWEKKQQNPKDHSWEKDPHDPPGITAMVCRAFILSGVDPDTDFIDKAYDHLIEVQKNTGGIYKDNLATYNTAIIISALAAAPEAEWQEPKDKAIKYLESLQWSDTIQGLPNNEQPVKKDDPRFGGFGYGSGKTGRPDLSNTQIVIDALHDAGVPKDNEAYKNALQFVSRCQNNSETNDQPWAGNDGSVIYSPSNGGMSPAGEYKDASGKTLKRGYGSMTYAALKSFMYCGLTHDDPRVKAAWNWITHNWTLDQNPGLSENDPATAQNGLYYYYYTLARAMHAYGEPVITDATGKQHDWRVELIAKLTSEQKPDGHWENEKDKWMEGNPILVTAYATLALQETLADLREHPVK